MGRKREGNSFLEKYLQVIRTELHFHVQYLWAFEDSFSNKNKKFKKQKQM